MTSRISFLGGLLLACLLAFMAAVVIVVMAAQAEEAARTQGPKSRNVLEQLNKAVAETLIAESGQREYLPTGEDSYLESYQAGARNFNAHLLAYENLVGEAATDAQRQNLAAMKTAAAAKGDELAATIRLYRAGDTDDALKMVKTNRGAELMVCLND